MSTSRRNSTSVYPNSDNSLGVNKDRPPCYNDIFTTNRSLKISPISVSSTMKDTATIKSSQERVIELTSPPPPYNRNSMTEIV